MLTMVNIKLKAQPHRAVDSCRINHLFESLAIEAIYCCCWTFNGIC